VQVVDALVACVTHWNEVTRPLAAEAFVISMVWLQRAVSAATVTARLLPQILEEPCASVDMAGPLASQTGKLPSRTLPQPSAE
jgi:hypothetical protein